jgi:mannose-6-phosphate isomerase class I
MNPNESRPFAPSPRPQILVGLAGHVSLECGGERIVLERGKAVIVPASAELCTIDAETQAEFIRATPGFQTSH